MFIKPSPGLTIVDPDMKDFIPPEGRDVPETIYWNRMVNDGDVIKATTTTTASKRSGSDTKQADA